MHYPAVISCSFAAKPHALGYHRPLATGPLELEITLSSSLYYLRTYHEKLFLYIQSALLLNSMCYAYVKLVLIGILQFPQLLLSCQDGLTNWRLQLMDFQPDKKGVLKHMLPSLGSYFILWLQSQICGDFSSLDGYLHLPKLASIHACLNSSISTKHFLVIMYISFHYVDLHITSSLAP